MMVSFRPFLEVSQGIQVLTLVFFDPAFVYFMYGDRVEVVQFFTPSSYRGDQLSVFKPGEMLRDRLAGHIEMCAELSQRLAALRAQSVQQTPSRRVSEGLEHIVNIHRNEVMQENTCMARQRPKQIMREGGYAQ
jgi:hypothetical protein